MGYRMIWVVEMKRFDEPTQKWTNWFWLPGGTYITRDDAREYASRLRESAVGHMDIRTRVRRYVPEKPKP